MKCFCAGGDQVLWRSSQLARGDRWDWWPLRWSGAPPARIPTVIDGTPCHQAWLPCFCWLFILDKTVSIFQCIALNISAITSGLISIGHTTWKLYIPVVAKWKIVCNGSPHNRTSSPAQNNFRGKVRAVLWPSLKQARILPLQQFCSDQALGTHWWWKLNRGPAFNQDYLRSGQRTFIAFFTIKCINDLQPIQIDLAANFAAMAESGPSQESPAAENWCFTQVMQ